MAQAVDTAGSAAPFVKFRQIGDTLIGAFGGSVQRQQRKWSPDGPGELLWKRKENPSDPDKPLLEEIFYFVAVAGGCTVVLGNEDDGFRRIEDREVVRFSVSGFKWNQAINAAKTLPAFRTKPDGSPQFAAGKRVTGDMWKITLVGYSADVPGQAAEQVYRAAGLTIVEGRVVMRTEQERTVWANIQIERRQNTNAAKDFEMVCRRVADQERAYEDAADEVYNARPWEKQEEVVAEQQAPAPKGADPWAAPAQPQQGVVSDHSSGTAAQWAEAQRQSTQPGPAAGGDPWAQPAAVAPPASTPAAADPWAPPAATKPTDPTDPSVLPPNSQPPW